MRGMAEGYQAGEREHFDRLAESEGATWWGRKTAAGVMRLERRARMARAFLGDLRGGSILEIGCGAGEFTEPLLGQYPDTDVVACDISPRALELGRARLAGRFPRAAFEVRDLCEPLPAARTFDAVVGCSILHHLPLAPTLRRCRELLAPGGRIWFSEPNMANPQVWLERNVRWIGERLDTTPDETAFFAAPLRRELERAGFVDVTVRPFDFLHPLVPRALARTADRFGQVLETLPFVREIAGSLEIRARVG